MKILIISIVTSTLVSYMFCKLYTVELTKRLDAIFDSLLKKEEKYIKELLDKIYKSQKL